MADVIKSPESHHNWWGSLVGTGLDVLRKLFKLSGEEDQAWQVVRTLIGQYFDV